MSGINKYSKNDCFRSKYIIANTAKTNKINSKLIKNVNNITTNKSFIGYNDSDYNNIEKMCNDDNVNLFVKNNATFNNISLNNELFLKNEIVNDIIIVNLTISPLNYEELLNNILSSISNNTFIYPSINFNSLNCNIQSGLLSVTKKFVLSNDVITAFILVFIIHSKSKILSVKPVLDTFVLLNSNENIIKVKDIKQTIEPIINNETEESNETEETNETEEFEETNEIKILNKSKNIIENFNDKSDIDISFFEIIK
jgi:hypothetical protein